MRVYRARLALFGRGHEIVVTSDYEVAEAGEEVLLGQLGGAVSCCRFPHELAISVYRAMALLVLPWLGLTRG